MRVILFVLLFPVILFSQNFTDEFNLFVDYKFLKINARIIDDQQMVAYLEELTATQLRVLRNTIFAQKGYIFNTEWLKKYFEGKDWYKGNTKDVELNDIEKQNVAFIKKIESRALPDTIEKSILQKFKDAKAIQAAILLESKPDSGSVWLVSLIPQKMQKKIIEISDHEREYHKISGTAYATHRGSRWLEAVKFINGQIKYLTFNQPNRLDSYEREFLEGTMEIAKSTEQLKVKDEIEDLLYSSEGKDIILRRFWREKNNPNIIRFIQATCCCGGDCAKTVFYVSLNNDKVDLEF